MHLFTCMHKCSVDIASPRTLCIQVLLPMAGLFDVDKELARLNKQRTKLQKDFDGVTARLSNAKFLEKASQVGAGALS